MRLASAEGKLPRCRAGISRRVISHVMCFNTGMADIMTVIDVIDSIYVGVVIIYMMSSDEQVLY